MIATTHGGALASLETRADSLFPLPSRAGAKLAAYLDASRFERPTLVMDLDAVAERYAALAREIVDRLPPGVRERPFAQALAIKLYLDQKEPPTREFVDRVRG